MMAALVTPLAHLHQVPNWTAHLHLWKCWDWFYLLISFWWTCSAKIWGTNKEQMISQTWPGFFYLTYFCEYTYLTYQLTAINISQQWPPTTNKSVTLYIHEVFHVTVSGLPTVSCNSMRMKKIYKVKSFIMWIWHVMGWYVDTNFQKACW